MSGSGATCPGPHIYSFKYNCKHVCMQAFYCSSYKSCLVLHFVLMASSRVQSLKDEKAYMALIKAHLQEPSKTTLQWKCSDLDVVVGHHVHFLCGVAHLGCSINETLLTKCLRDMFASSTQECKEFAKKLAEALSYCRAKAKPGQCSSGVKTHAAVLQVIGAVRTAKGEVDKGKSPSPSPSPASPSPSPTSAAAVEAEESEVEVVGTPPRKSGPELALENLMKAFADDISEAAPSKPKALDDSPISIASSAASPPQVSTASSSTLQFLPLQVFLCNGGGLHVQS